MDTLRHPTLGFSERPISENLRFPLACAGNILYTLPHEPQLLDLDLCPLQTDSLDCSQELIWACRKDTASMNNSAFRGTATPTTVKAIALTVTPQQALVANADANERLGRLMG